MQRVKEKVWIELGAQRLEFGTCAEILSARRSRLLRAKPLGGLDRVNDAGNGDIDQ